MIALWIFGTDKKSTKYSIGLKPKEYIKIFECIAHSGNAGKRIVITEADAVTIVSINEV